MTHVSSNLRTLVLNADMQPLSWAPLSVWTWQEAIVAVMQDRVIQLKAYEDVVVRSAARSYEVPAVVALKSYHRKKRATFTRFHLFLRDEFTCQYCGNRFPSRELTFDHVIPRSKGGRSEWSNIVACCPADNLKKGNLTPRQAGMRLLREPREPSPHELDSAARRLHWATTDLHQTWLDFLYWDSEIET
ncbi:HNH endonuclease [Paracraurococcus lichenis]|uniref:HNH endonuclease n=1 Tax=Paracraurococcus lichenis TaxID=3064888 RepID=A0ABT9DTR3_9PROT|nr:HNH endonuclease [Paracraurococcus sp. LOR1-02]MDO9707190.1 HNH endonuclease [Paracraurococcus sp. LOR1-02]